MPEWAALVELLQPLGIAGIVCVVVIVIACKERQRADSEREAVRTLSEDIRTTLIQLNKESTKVAVESTAAIQAASAHIRMSTEELKQQSKEYIAALNAVNGSIQEVGRTIEKTVGQTNDRIDRWIIKNGTMGG